MRAPRLTADVRLAAERTREVIDGFSLGGRKNFSLLRRVTSRALLFGATRQGLAGYEPPPPLPPRCSQNPATSP